MIQFKNNKPQQLLYEKEMTLFVWVFFILIFLGEERGGRGIPQTMSIDDCCLSLYMIRHFPVAMSMLNLQ